MKATIKVLRTEAAARLTATYNPTTTRPACSHCQRRRVFELKLYDSNDPQVKPLLPPLLEARVVSMRNNRMLFKA